MTVRSADLDASPPRTLYVIATVHLDTQWRWTVQDTIREFLPATLERNFELLERFPFFVVSFEGAFRYQLMKEYYPREFEQLRRWVETERWCLAGSMLDAPDVNVVSPESLLRHILYGNRFFQQEFGRRSNDLFLPDGFGFGWALPSVAAHCGLVGFSGQKFGRWMAPAEIPFDVGVWQGPDGAEIIAAIRPEGYGEGLREDLSLARRFLDRLDETGKRCGASVGVKYVGVGDRGGGLDEESMEWLRRSVHGEGPVRVVVAGSGQIYEDLEAEEIARLPRHRDELLLPTHGTGCLTSQAILKRWNRRNELLADATERAAVMADTLAGLPYPAERLTQAWTRFLWHQMHDDLTGTSIPDAYAFTDNDELLSLNQFASILTHSVGACAARMDTRVSGDAIAVFNPLSIEREDVVQVDLAAAPQTTEAPRVIDPDGLETPSQTLGRGDNGRFGLVFLARLPPLGIGIYDLTSGPSSASPDSSLEVSQSGLANQRYRIDIDAQGDVRGVWDRRSRRQLLAAAIRLQLLRDRSARWPAWEILYRDVVQAKPDLVSGPAQVRVLEHGPVRVAVEVLRRWRRSRFRQVLRLSAGEAGERVEVLNEVDWRTRGRMLKASFTLAGANPQALYDLGLGVIERGNNRREKYEVPAQQWAALRSVDGVGGASVLNDCKYGWDKPDDRTLRLTLLRSPRVVRRFRHQGRQDHGRHRFTYALFGHDDDWDPSASAWQAARVNQPLMAFRVPSHPGPLDRRVSFLRLSSEQIALQALKISERGDRLVLRLRELAGRDSGPVSVRLAEAPQHAVEVDGMEDEIGPASASAGNLTTSFRPFDLKSFAVGRSASRAKPGSLRAVPVELPFNVTATRAQGRIDRTGFDGQGNSIPSELWPDRLRFGCAEFELGSAAPDRLNAVSCRGQTIPLRPAERDRIHLLMASTSAETKATVGLGTTARTVVVGPFSLRLRRRAHRRAGWLRGAAPSVVGTIGDRHPVAWVGTHRHGPDGADQPYTFCYLFAYALELPPDCGEITLPIAPAVHLFAASLVSDIDWWARPAAALYD